MTGQGRKKQQGRAGQCRAGLYSKAGHGTVGEDSIGEHDSRAGHGKV